MALPLADEIEFWHTNGFQRVGVLATKLAAGGWRTPLAQLNAAQLDICYVINGIYTVVTDDAGWARERDALARSIDAAAELGAPMVNISSGRSGELRWHEALDALAERLEPAIAHARATGISLTLEGSLSSRTEFSFILSTADAVAAARALGIDVCVDLYTCWVERGLRETLRDNVERIKLVQFADFVIGTMCQPNRWVPGDGDLPLERLLDDVLGAGYGGIFDVELIGPAIDDEGAASALARGARWLTERLPAQPSSSAKR